MNSDKEISEESQRSFFSLNILEFAVAIVAAGITWFIVFNYLQTALPFPCSSSTINQPIECTERFAWLTIGQPLFSSYAIPLIIVSGIASVFLVRFIRQDVKDISSLGNIALAWPLLAILTTHFLAYFGICFLPFGFVISIIATIMSVEEKKHKWDWISLPLSFVSMVIIGMYLGELLSLYGD